MLAWSFFTIAIQRINIKLEFSYVHSFHQIQWLSKGRLWKRRDFYFELIGCTEIECEELLRDGCEKSIIARNRTVRFVSDGGMMTYYATWVRSTISRSSSSHLDAFATQSILRDVKFWKVLIERQKMGEQFRNQRKKICFLGRVDVGHWGGGLTDPSKSGNR